MRHLSRIVRSVALPFIASLAMVASPAAAQLCPPTVFGAPVTVATDAPVISMSFGDFNGDGAPDAVLVHFDGSIGIRLATGPAAFGAEQPIATGRGVVAVGDFNGDGNADLVAATLPTDPMPGVNLLLGNGDGTFRAPVLTAIGWAAESITVGDADGDGKLDLVASGYPGGSWYAALLLGNGDGSFRVTGSAGNGYWYGVSRVFLADMDGDGRADVTVSAPNGIYVWLQDASGALKPAVNMWGGWTALEAWDIAGIGRAQVVLADTYGYGTLSLLSLSGGGLGTTPIPVNVPNAFNAVARDMNGDGRKDLVLSSYGPDYVLLTATGGADYFRRDLSQQIGPAYGLAIEDVNGDGLPDFVTPGGEDLWFRVYPNLRGATEGIGIYVNGDACPTAQTTASAPDTGTGTTWAWEIQGGYPAGDPTQRSFAFTPDYTGTEVVLSVTVVPPGCAPLHGTLHVPVIQFGDITAPDMMCPSPATASASVPDAGPGSTYDWSTYGGSIVSGQGTPSVVFAGPNPNNPNMQLYCHVTKWNGCYWNYQKTITARPDAWFQTPAAICAGGTGTATVDDQGPGATYLWVIADGSILSGQGTRTVTYTSTHSPYTGLSLTVTSPEGCSLTYDSLASIYALPNATITAPATICASATGSASVPGAGSGATYAWTITGGTITSGLGTLSITFRAGTSGSVTLGVTVVNQASCSASSSVVVPISPLPTTFISGSSVLCSSSPGTASVTDAGPGATYVWSITGGTITGGAGTPAITFMTGPGASLTLTCVITTASGCTTSPTKNIILTAQPSATITAPASLCPNGAGTASIPYAGSGATYTWTLTNATRTGGVNNTVTFTAGSTGPVTVAVSVRSAAGCTVSNSKSIPLDPVPDATITTAGAVCIGSTPTASVTDAGTGATYTWTLTNGSITSGAGTRQIGFTPLSAGPVTIGVTVRSGAGCSATGSSMVNASTPPSSAITTVLTACANAPGLVATVPDAGAGATYVWTITNGTITAGAGTAAITFTAGASGSTTLNATVTSAAGCSTGSVRAVAINAPPSAAISTPAIVCASSAGNTASVADAGTGATYTWTISGGTITSGAGTRSVTFTATASGTVTLNVTVVNAAGCSAGSSAAVAIGAIPSAAITAPASLCAGKSGSASVPTAGDGATYAWSISGGTITSGAGTPTITFSPLGAGTVNLGVTVTSGAGCASSSAGSVAIVAPPSATVTAASTVCASSTGNTASVPDAGTGATYSWSISGGTITAGSGTRAITWTAGASGTATISVSVVNGSGCAASGSANVTIAAVPSATITAASSVRKNSTGNVASVPSAGTGASYTWTITNGTITTGAGTASITYKAGSRGTLTLNVTVRNASGCSASGTRNVTVTN